MKSFYPIMTLTFNENSPKNLQQMNDELKFYTIGSIAFCRKSSGVKFERNNIVQSWMEVSRLVHAYSDSSGIAGISEILPFRDVQAHPESSGYPGLSRSEMSRLIQTSRQTLSTSSGFTPTHLKSSFGFLQTHLDSFGFVRAHLDLPQFVRNLVLTWSWILFFFRDNSIPDNIALKSI